MKNQITIERRAMDWKVSFYSGETLEHTRTYAYPEIVESDQQYMLSDMVEWCNEGKAPSV